MISAPPETSVNARARSMNDEFASSVAGSGGTTPAPTSLDVEPTSTFMSRIRVDSPDRRVRDVVRVGGDPAQVETRERCEQLVRFPIRGPVRVVEQNPAPAPYLAHRRRNAR